MSSALSTSMLCGLLRQPCCGYSLQTRPSLAMTQRDTEWNTEATRKLIALL
jgi:hypothetical protein